MRNKKLKYSQGINDVDYAVTKWAVIDGKSKQVWRCPYHKKWYSMHQRCYSPKYHEDFPTYIDCEVSLEWMKFSNFREWCLEYERKYDVSVTNCDLDKDILHKGNKIYSPELVF